ncbi:MAG: GNAT family N-acetyltransferase [Thermoplasmata archaeon]
MKIRNANPEDIEEILAMLKKAASDPRFSFMSREEYMKRFMRTPYYMRENHLLMFSGNTLVGELLASADVGYGVLKSASVGVRITFLAEYLTEENVKQILSYVESGLKTQGYTNLQITVNPDDKLRKIIEKLGFCYDSSGYWMIKEDRDLPQIRHTEGVCVRAITPTEIDEFYNLVNLSFSTDPNWQPYNYADFAEKYIYPEYVDFQGYFIAEFEGRKVGTVAAWAHQNHGSKGLIGGEIRALGVLPEYRKKGIGKMLLERSIIYLIKRGMQRFYLGTDSYNLPALAIYSKFGFRVFREYLRYRKKIT